VIVSRAVSTALLPCVEVEARGPASASVVWMHGLGADGHDFESLVPHLRLPHVRFVFPNAPAIPVTINGGFVMPAWYDIRSLDLQPGTSTREDPAQVRRSAAAIAAIVDREIVRGVPADRIVLAGFSQGGAMALHVAPRFPHTLAGFMVLSAYELLRGTLADEQHEANRTTPALFCHGSRDPMVPMFAGQAACESVRAPGRDVRWYDFPIGHEVSLPEIQTIASWLLERLPPR
jgi:phospholipase/carboxylesterase